MAGVYYGIMETRDNNNVSNMPNRLVFRSDGNLEGAYKFENQTRLGVHADYTLVFRQHDKDYNDGDWRFYPYALAEIPNMVNLPSVTPTTQPFSSTKGRRKLPG